MTVLDLRLNMAIMVVDCETAGDLEALFRERAEIVRAGVRGSPRGQTTPRMDEYNGFVSVPLVGGYLMLFESSDVQCGLPLNLCAFRFLGVEFYGPVALVRIIEQVFCPINDGLFATHQGLLLATVAPSRLKEYERTRTLSIK